MIPFSIKIHHFSPAQSAFTVEYIADDESYDRITQIVHIDLIDGSTGVALTKDAILALISSNCPQIYWQKQDIIKNTIVFDGSTLVDTVHTSEDTTQYLQNLVDSIAPITLETPAPTVSNQIDDFIKEILNEQQK